MKRRELLEALANIGTIDEVGSSEFLAGYWMLHEFIMQNTKEEEKIPALLKGSDDDT